MGLESLPFPIIMLLGSALGTAFRKAQGKAKDKEDTLRNAKIMQDIYGVDTSALTAREKRRIATGNPFIDILASGGQQVTDLITGAFSNEADTSVQQQQQADQGQAQGQAEAPAQPQQSSMQEIISHTGVPPALSTLMQQQQQPQPQPRQQRAAPPRSAGLPSDLAGMSMADQTTGIVGNPRMPVGAPGSGGPMGNPQQAVRSQLMGLPEPNAWLQQLGAQQQAQQPITPVSTGGAAPAAAPVPAAAPTMPQGPPPSIAEQMAQRMPVGGELSLPVGGGGHPGGPMYTPPGEMKFTGPLQPVAAKPPSNYDEAILQASMAGDTAAVEHFSKLKLQNDPTLKDQAGIAAQLEQLYGPNDPRTQAAWAKVLQEKSTGASRSSTTVNNLAPPPAKLLDDIAGIEDLLHLVDELNETKFWETTGPIQNATNNTRAFFDLKPDQEITADLIRNQFNTQLRLKFAGQALTETEVKNIEAISLMKYSQPNLIRAQFAAIRKSLLTSYESKHKIATAIQRHEEIPHYQPNAPEVNPIAVTQSAWDEQVARGVSPNTLADMGYFVKPERVHDTGGAR